MNFVAALAQVRSMSIVFCCTVSVAYLWLSPSGSVEDSGVGHEQIKLSIMAGGSAAKHTGILQVRNVRRFS